MAMRRQQGTSFYQVLGVERDASMAEIRKAYRKAALINHPDKNPDDREGAEKRFVRVAQAYEVLGDEAARARYDHGGGVGDGTALDRGFDFSRANDMFNANFGEALMRQWQPGMRISGTMVANGKRVSVTIHPDGTTEETESATGRTGGYRTVSTSGPGGSMHTVHLEGGLGENLAAFLLPEVVAGLPVVGPAMVTAVSWVPTLLCGICCAKFLGLR